MSYIREHNAKKLLLTEGKKKPSKKSSRSAGSYETAADRASKRMFAAQKQINKYIQQLASAKNDKDKIVQQLKGAIEDLEMAARDWGAADAQERQSNYGW